MMKLGLRLLGVDRPRELDSFGEHGRVLLADWNTRHARAEIRRVEGQAKILLDPGKGEVAVGHRVERSLLTRILPPLYRQARHPSTDRGH
jgi:hypothetical protein